MEDGSPQKAQQRPERNFLQDKEATGTHILVEVERGRSSCFLVSDFSSVPFSLWLNFLCGFSSTSGDSKLPPVVVSHSAGLALLPASCVPCFLLRVMGSSTFRIVANVDAPPS